MKNFGNKLFPRWAGELVDGKCRRDCTVSRTTQCDGHSRKGRFRAFSQESWPRKGRRKTGREGRPAWCWATYVKGRPCGDAHGTGSRLGQGERSTKTYFLNCWATWTKVKTRAKKLPFIHTFLNCVTFRSIEKFVQRRKVFIFSGNKMEENQLTTSVTCVLVAWFFL